MTDSTKLEKTKFDTLKGFYHDVIGEAFLLVQDGKTNINVFPRTYHVKFFIFLRPDEQVTDISYKVVKHGFSEENKPAIQTIKITTSNASAAEGHGKGNWLGYEFEITKFVPDALVLEFSVNDSDTDPKPKVIFEDPIEIDPADDVSH
ncbi:hypothetical protein [Roseivirga pacifica]|uniref:hypothetical protein n=1 Tax=Roseivirga pacifica TaxID=1267423 RepID=UPI003BA9240A